MLRLSNSYFCRNFPNYLQRKLEGVAVASEFDSCFLFRSVWFVVRVQLDFGLLVIGVAKASKIGNMN